MPIYTQRELVEKRELEKSNSPDSNNDISSGSPIRLEEEKESAKAPPLRRFNYYLLHPENGVGHLQNFQDTLTIDGKDYKRKCVNGTVVTQEEVLADFLMFKGYQLMEKIDASTDSNRNQSFLRRV